MKSVLVIGANGMLGYAASEYFKRSNYYVESITRKEFDIAKDGIEELENIVKNIDFAVNCAGIINKRISEFPIEDVLRVNAIFPRNLAKLCGKYEKLCFHITTDCVFSGKRGMYTESDYFDATLGDKKIDVKWLSVWYPGIHTEDERRVVDHCAVGGDVAIVAHSDNHAHVRRDGREYPDDILRVGQAHVVQSDSELDRLAIVDRAVTIALRETSVVVINRDLVDRQVDTL